MISARSLDLDGPDFAGSFAQFPINGAATRRHKSAVGSTDFRRRGGWSKFQQFRQARTTLKVVSTHAYRRPNGFLRGGKLRKKPLMRPEEPRPTRGAITRKRNHNWYWRALLRLSHRKVCVSSSPTASAIDASLGMIPKRRDVKRYKQY